MVEDTRVRAHFEASRFLWAFPLQLDAVRAFAGRGGRVAVAGARSVTLLDDGALVGELPFTSTGGILSLAIADDGATVVGVFGGYAQEYAAGGGPGAGGVAVIVVDPAGAVRWARYLPTASPSYHARVGSVDGDVVVVWSTAGAVTLDDVSVSASAAVLTRFDGQTGDLVALVGLGERPMAVGGDAAGRVWIRGGNWVGGPAQPLPGLALPETTGPWFVLFEPDLELADGWRWASQTPPVPTASWADSTSSRADVTYVDDALRPRFGATISGVGDPSQLVAQTDGRLVVGDVYVPALGLPIWEPGGARATLQVLAPGARPGATWVTPDADEVETWAVAASGLRAYAVVQAKAAPRHAQPVARCVGRDGARLPGGHADVQRLPRHRPGGPLHGGGHAAVVRPDRALAALARDPASGRLIATLGRRAGR